MSCEVVDEEKSAPHSCAKTGASCGRVGPAPADAGSSPLSHWLDPPLQIESAATNSSLVSDEEVVARRARSEIFDSARSIASGVKGLAR